MKTKVFMKNKQLAHYSEAFSKLPDFSAEERQELLRQLTENTERNKRELLKDDSIRPEQLRRVVKL